VIDDNIQSKEEREASEFVQEIKKQERKGIYKNIDLYKMHAYKDAIRRSGGAYILYPGTANEGEPFRGFHEIIPGVGAFSIRPSNEGDASENIKQFIDKVIENLEDVLSQRERISRSAKSIYNTQYKSQDPKLDKLLRELGSEEIPDETNVLIGYCKDENHRNWISGNQQLMRYNIRYGSGYGVSGKMASARYLILYSNKDFLHREIYKIKPDSARIFTKSEMENLNYNKPSHSLYFVYELQEKIELDTTYYFDEKSANLSNKLSVLKTRYLPFTINLLELAQLRKLKTAE